MSRGFGSMTEHERGREDDASLDEAIADASGDTAKVPSEDDPTAEGTEARDPDLEQD
jgi:hypothetical protein